MWASDTDWALPTQLWVSLEELGGRFSDGDRERWKLRLAEVNWKKYYPIPLKQTRQRLGQDTIGVSR